MITLPTRNAGLRKLYDALIEYVDEMGVSNSAAVIGVSSDTIRRRTRGEQPWFLEEVVDLAIHQAKNRLQHPICSALIEMCSAKREVDLHPLRLPSNLRDVLRLVGKVTTEIAETLEDGRVDTEEAKRLIMLFDELGPMVKNLRAQLQILIERS